MKEQAGPAHGFQGPRASQILCTANYFSFQTAHGFQGPRATQILCTANYFSFQTVIKRKIEILPIYAIHEE